VIDVHNMLVPGDVYHIMARREGPFLVIAADYNAKNIHYLRQSVLVVYERGVEHVDIAWFDYTLVARAG
jgi:hypothetical protein